ncbi:MAG TPA: DUF3536 domain-containing protein [Vicinamibacteria bacterium]|nr:DUF3536 domain-containing protein [Vicinamibacteria bacterium]
MKYVTVHGHFYQPPRENPWLEAIEPQDSARPYHDWNERILAECYAPNAASRILDDDERIVAIVNNYSRISFDFGPTLLSWIEREAPAVYSAILEADKESQLRFSGHGSALAHVYNHAIMPLARKRDKEIQVVWGIRDFEHRFHRRPEGMWLAETAADLETLDVLSAHGIRFTILAPSQARRTRRRGNDSWDDVTGGRIDTTLPYVQRLPSGRTIVIFFYDGTVSKAIAFEGLLHRGESLANRLLSIARDDGKARLAHVATDGESYGHHHPHGDMALAFALDSIDRNVDARLTNYGEFLERFPPGHEVEILENTSWSCAHGIERWRSSCGCRTGGSPSWSQAWRAPLRAALDWLRDETAARLEAKLADYVKDPLAAILDYIELILDRDPAKVDERLGELTEPQKVTVLKLLELERQLQLAYTSCGWFFNDLAGIETIQILRYAGRAVQLAEDVFGQPIEAEFLQRLDLAVSNRPEAGTGRDIYLRSVRPAMITWEMLCAHYCISTLFQPDGEIDRVYSFDVERVESQSLRSGAMRLMLGRVRLTSRITRSTERLSFAVLHLGDHTVTAGVELDRLSGLATELVGPFRSADTTVLLRSLDQRFGGHIYNLRSLFGDEQRKIVDFLLQSSLEDAEAAHRSIYERHWGTVRFLADLGVPLPPALSVAAEVALNARLRKALSDWRNGAEEIGSLVREAVEEGVRLDEPALAWTARTSLDALAEAYFAAPGDRAKLSALRERVRLVRSLPFEVELWKVQNLYFQCLKSGGPGFQEFLDLGNDLSIRLGKTRGNDGGDRRQKA